MLRCIYCSDILYCIRDMGYYYFCRQCAAKHDVDVLYSCTQENISIVHLGFSHNGYKFRLTISPWLQAMHIISFPRNKSNVMLDYAVIEGKMRRIIHPHVHIDKGIKIFEVPWNYLYTPENVKTKIKNLIIFS